jgi:competence ComEA-like helix-hairpin-helix protein
MAKVTQERIQSFAFVISVCMCVGLSAVIMARSLAGLGRPCQIQLDEKINPNIAPSVSLLRLQGVGSSRAEAIVTYRENFVEKGRKGPAFQDVNDLQKVRGIGPRTAQNISQWLKFE